MLISRRASTVGPVAAQPRRKAVVTRVAAHEANAQKTYYIAMNVFKIKPESYEDFEQVWKTRESYLKQTPGFIRFALLKCENVPGKYISQSYWESKDAFQAWTKSQAFAAGHASSSGSSSKRPNTMNMMDGPPSPEFYSSVTVTE